jgi:hypothetical protein
VVLFTRDVTGLFAIMAALFAISCPLPWGGLASLCGISGRCVKNGVVMAGAEGPISRTTATAFCDDHDLFPKEGSLKAMRF